MAARATPLPADDLSARLAQVRALSLALAAPLSDADASVPVDAGRVARQMALAHTTWFFETFVLRDHVPGYCAFDARYAFLFNSYYEAEGARHAREARGLITRPSLDEVRAWRGHVDAALAERSRAGRRDARAGRAWAAA
jgi:hypothetical protein